MSEEIVIRFAKVDDLDFAYQDGYIPAEVLKRKIKAQTAFNPDRIEDIVIAEWNDKTGRGMCGLSICGQLCHISL